MDMRGQAGTVTYDTSESGTIYWTLSLYIEADKVVSILNEAARAECVAAPRRFEARARVDPAHFRRMQRDHRPSLALAYAIDPLMNDIADRETHGEVQEFLLASTPHDYADMHEARVAVRQCEDLTFHVPEAISWETEGVRFEARPSGLKSARKVRLRRFWLSHNDGALSYHMSFSHHYADGASGRTGYDPSTLYFLSILQKLAAPKEYALDEAALARAKTSDTGHVDVFDDQKLGIAPLDDIRIEHPFGTEKGQQTRVDGFWPFVAAAFETDAEVLFDRLATTCDTPKTTLRGRALRETLLDSVPFIEVPGLAAPKSRFMFMLHDRRFFDRLMPLDPVSKEAVSRKVMVQPDCYDPYGRRMSELKTHVEEQKAAVVTLDQSFWDWVARRPDYAKALRGGVFVRQDPTFDDSRDEGADNRRWQPITRVDDLVAAMRIGECFERDKTGAVPIQRHIPAFEAGRSDCLEYLFLAGFNQNIIDFMNQDTSRRSWTVSTPSIRPARTSRATGSSSAMPTIGP